VQYDGWIRQTNELDGKEPRDAGSLRFYYNSITRQYWMHRINLRNPSNPNWMAGPFELPKK
jgi:hypothetical protein